jgi:hypothetical protein
VQAIAKIIIIIYNYKVISRTLKNKYDMKEFITKDETDLPVGTTGFFISKDFNVGNLVVYKVELIEESLYKLFLQGLRFVRGDEFGAEYSSCFGCVILDMDDRSIISGYAEKMSNDLYAILDVNSTLIGWPADDDVVIKNIKTGEKTYFSASASLEEKFRKEKNLFIFEGYLGVVHGDKVGFEETKRWRAFINEKGEKIYKGFCWEYSIEQNFLFVKKGKRSKKEYRFPV